MKCQCGRIMMKIHWKDRIKWICSCGLMWWDGSKSTPATQEVFNLRKQCHEKFDLLCKSRKMKRQKAYNHMKKLMNLHHSRCNIGLFQKEECLKLLSKLKE